MTSQHPRPAWWRRLVAGAALAAAVAVTLGAALAPASGAAAKPAGATAAGAYSFGPYQRLLDQYLHVASAPGEPLVTRFDYLELFRSPGRTMTFDGVRDSLLGVDPRQMSVAQRHAWAINTYNFLVLQLATDNIVSRHVSTEAHAHGIFGIVIKSPRDVRVDGTPFFEVPVVRIGNRDYSLDQFETAFVFDGVPRPGPGVTPRRLPPSFDPRAHLAIVNGTLGAAPLQPRAFRPESLDAQLDRACRDALASPRRLRWDAEIDRLYATMSITQYVDDFGGPGGAFAFVRRYAPDSLRARLDAKPAKVIDLATAWDWEFNMIPLPPRKGAPSSP